MIPYGRQDISKEDVAAVVEALTSDWLTTGPAIERFEDALKARVRAAHAVASANGTVSLHLAVRALGLGPGDELWTSANTFVASSNCGLYCGATVDFVDIDPKTWNMSVESLEQKLDTRKPPKVLVPVHFSGASCDMRAIRALSQKHGFSVLEDASHAVGATYLGEPVGSCRYSDVVSFSFHPVKIVTSAEGGMALTQREDLASKMRMLRAHGVNREKAATEGAFYYEMEDLGYNYRLTDLHAALGASQVKRLDAFLARRTELAARYDRLLERLPVTRPWVSPDGRSAWHLYVVLVANRRKVYDAMREAGIGVNVHYMPVHLHPYYRKMGFKPGDFPRAEAYYASAITLPLYPGLTDEAQDQVVAALAQALKAAG